MAIRIEYFIDHLKVGGAQRHLVELFAGLDRRRFVPQVCVAKAGGALEPVLQAMRVPVRAFGVQSSLARPSTLHAPRPRSPATCECMPRFGKTR